MELLKGKDNLTYEIGDVKFFIRPQMTVRDKFEIDIVGEYKDGKVSIKPGAIFHKFIELFVIGWDGVTEDGKPVPYSYETFMARLPGDIADDWILRLGAFISEKLNLLPKTDEETKKND